MKLKILLIGWVVLGTSMQTLASPTGVAEPVEEYVDDKVSTCTRYFKTGEIDQVVEYVDGKQS
ncbi:MAG: hypothetical protein DSZ19_01715, partial [Candidatus Thioglobus sp.]